MNYRILPIFLFCSALLQAYNAEHVRKLQAALKQGGTVNASHCDLRGLGTLLKGTDFTNVQLSGSSFDTISSSPTPAASLIKIPGQQSDLTGANFSNCCLVSVSFRGAILQGANFTGADIMYADFSGADLTGVIGLDSAKNKRLARYCGATMPDGTKPTTSTWTSQPTSTSSSGTTYYLRCANSK